MIVLLRSGKEIIKVVVAFISMRLIDSHVRKCRNDSLGCGLASVIVVKIAMDIVVVFKEGKQLLDLTDTIEHKEVAWYTYADTCIGHPCLDGNISE